MKAIVLFCLSLLPLTLWAFYGQVAGLGPIRPVVAAARGQTTQALPTATPQPGTQPLIGIPHVPLLSAPAPAFAVRAQPRTMPAARSTEQGCSEVVRNGDFEQQTEWGGTQGNTFYSTDYAWTGVQSVTLDTFNGNWAVIWQRINIPANANSMTIDFYSTVLTSVLDENVYVRLYDASSGAVLFWRYLIYECTCEWNHFSIPLRSDEVAAVQGRTVDLQMELYVVGAVDKINVDAFSLQVCQAEPPPPPPPPPSTATPTNTPTNTSIPPTHTPTNTSTNTATNTPVPPTATPTATPTTPVADVYEPDNGCTAAKPLTPDGAVQEHLFGAAADLDWVRFELMANVDYRIEVQIPPDSPADVTLELYSDCAVLPINQWNQSFAPGARLDFKPTTSGVYFLQIANVKPEIAGAHVAYRVSVRPNTAQPIGALIILAGRLKTSDPLQANIHHVTDGVYKLFQTKGYTNDDIYYLTTDPSRPGHDATATKSNLRAAITQWAQTKVGGARTLTLYMMDHGDKGKFYIDKPTDQTLTPGDLDTWLTELETAVPGVKINVVIEACNAGSFIADVQRISKPGRVILASTSEKNLAYASATGAHFSDHLITALAQGQHLANAFWEAQAAVRKIVTFQDPWMDSDGDGAANEAEDNVVATERWFGQGTLSGGEGWAPYIAAANPLVIHQSQAAIQAEVRDDKDLADVDVWAVIYPPSYTPPQSQDELAPETLDTLKLLPQGNNLFAATYRAFTEAGMYRIVIHAEDGENLEARPVTLEVKNGSRLLLPLMVR